MSQEKDITMQVLRSRMHDLEVKFEASNDRADYEAILETKVAIDWVESIEEEQ